MKSITVSIDKRSLKGTVRLPASKSISNRVMIIRALSGEQFPVGNLSDADDTQLLGVLLQKISGNKRIRACELDTANAGTVMRFLTACLSIIPGRWVLTGSDRMRERPIGVLVEALNSLGAEIEYLSKPGFPPLLIKGKTLNGGELHVDAGISSQYISALMMIAPQLQHGLTIRYRNRPVSLPYIEMTAKLMQVFGIKVTVGKTHVSVKQGSYAAAPFEVEPDWSSAAFWYEAAALASDTTLELPGLVEKSLQGDSVLPGIFANFGIATEFTSDGVKLKRNGKKSAGFYFDFTDHPDLAPAVITTCAALGIRGRFEGLNSLRIKETDRISALKAEYEKLGIEVESAEITDMLQSIEIAPLKKKKTELPANLLFETYGDHRMAMTFAPLALKLGPVRIVNPDVVTKSYPGFWEEMKAVGFDIR
jgi:3-phosphoshikimate 1-carboxyvinyltransferase